MERRNGSRYPLLLEMRIIAVDCAAVMIAAHTCNVSLSGVLFRSRGSLQVGQQLEYVIDLNQDCSVQLKCRGRVVRSVGGDAIREASCLVAATIDAYECVRGGANNEASRLARYYA
jgi:hypothetical protein